MLRLAEKTSNSRINYVKRRLVEMTSKSKLNDDINMCQIRCAIQHRENIFLTILFDFDNQIPMIRKINYGGNVIEK